MRERSPYTGTHEDYAMLKSAPSRGAVGRHTPGRFPVACFASWLQVGFYSTVSVNVVEATIEPLTESLPLSVKV
jgi:hypothetical protein